jgi:D-3-phosphoglycerate dehydrogenase
MARGASALLGATFRGGVIGREILASLPELRIVSKYTIGVDDVDVDAATEMGVLVTHCPTEANWGGVAEGTLAFILALLKRVRERDAQVKAGRWRDPALTGTYMGARADGYPGLTIGIIGFGRIGCRVAELLVPWRVRVLAYDPYVADERIEAGAAQPAALDFLLRESDVVTLHCNLTEETRGLMGPAQIASMKPGALLVNTSRGCVVDVEALCDALDSGALTAAALDVLPEEPPPVGARVLGMGDKVILSPHMVAANTLNPLAAAVPLATEAVVAALRGEVPERVYNVDAIDNWRSRFAGRSVL